MKRCLVVLACAAVLSACSGDESDVAKAVPPNPDLEGLWVSETAYDTRNPANRYTIPSDELMYLAFADASDNPVNTTVYVHSDTSNCFHRNSGPVTHIGNDVYRDSNSSETLTFRVGNQGLTMVMSIEGLTLGTDFSEVTAISEVDLPVCTFAQSSIQDDDSPSGLIDQVISAAQ